MKTVTTYDFRNNLAGYLNVVSGEKTTLLVSRFGKPVAIVSPYRTDLNESYKDFFGFLGVGETGAGFVNKVRRSKKEAERIKELRNR